EYYVGRAEKLPLHCRSLITYSLESIMYVNQQSSLAMPAPRAPMNQKIDTDNAMVQNHNAIYQQLLDQIRDDNTYTHAVITLILMAPRR
ncbi:TPA: hypothetical protein ACIT97_004423, partial [Salmonella enterica subsp. enterica serovar Virchow]